MARDARADDDEHFTLRVTLRPSRFAIAALAALLLHGLFGYAISLLPNPAPKATRIEVSLAPSRAAPAPSAPAPTAPPPRKPKVARASPPPQTSPVLPELPPPETPTPERAQLPVVERAPEPAPPPTSDSWFDKQLAQLRETRPRPTPTIAGALAPSLAILDRVANADPRLHDEENERRMIEDFGIFFRRGLDALRGRWHPDVVLDAETVRRRCGRHEQTTFAIAVLDKEGNVLDVELKAPSSCPELDAEAIAAFKRVAQFPHPPKGIFFGPDGSPLETARYPVRFIVTFGGGLQLQWN